MPADALAHDDSFGSSLTSLGDLDGDGVLSMDEQSLRAMANDIYSAINEAG